MFHVVAHFVSQLVSDADVELVAGDSDVECLLLQGRPIDEPVAQRGPFVMNTEAELRTAVLDYQRTEFGGWSFDSDAPVHARDTKRFARMSDGTIIRPTASS